MVESRREPVSREALEFSSGLLSIQEAPPGKLPKTVMYLVLILFALLLGWAIFGKLDIVASAEGRLIPQSYVKIVQPSEAGIVQDIFIHEGDSVTAGQLLMKMDANSTLSDSNSVEGEMKMRSLQLRRIDAELGKGVLTQMSNDPSDLFMQAQQQYNAHRSAYHDAYAQEEQTLKKAQEDYRSAQEVLNKLEQTLPTYQKNASAYASLAKDGFASVMEAKDKEREMIEKAQDLKAQVATVAGLKAAITASEKKLMQITSNDQSQLENERLDAQSQYKRLTQEWGKNVHKTSLLELRAPQSGTIKDLATHTRGTVVSPGTVLMSLVPHDDPLQAEVMIKNEDVGFVHAGQKVKLKLTAYPFQKYGMIDGEVIYVGADAMQQQTQPTQQNTSEKDNSSTQSNILNYKALVRLHTQTLTVEDKQLALTPGMQVMAEIHLGKRTVMEYLLSPVQKAWQESGRER
ncbi:HlyD family type I secretion periplasmic adaptor subunit [Sulfuricurvum sp.]|uniref:HlyD family type I secretion periplasmic adaptor subunit n=1 Tax=Sulfuricurvum sp. TaxID=2025608 RepID=UPI002604A770|nr:HlyD family type I secretion periplasmic adaptor subunit [Sulfuricurvum sp.]MDD4950695.1 HlyD family type I secretion periplasmic adaptor subunit [Sulfuricurvum sp.]